MTVQSLCDFASSRIRTLATRELTDVPIGDGRHAVLGMSRDLDPDTAVRALVLDGAQALALRDREERPLHHVGMVFRRVIDQIRDEEVADGMRVGTRCGR